MSAASPGLRVANLTGLLWLRELCRGCMERAAMLFDIDHETARFYRDDLTDGAIEDLSRELDVSLFVPRFDSQTLPEALASVAGNGEQQKAPGLELHNLGRLQALCEACHRSTGEAAWVYRINCETAEAYRALGHEQLVGLCRTLQVSALLPRYDAAEAARILDKPAGSRALFAAAYETDIAATSEVARRCFYLTH